MRQDDFAIAERVATHENTDGYQIEKNESLYSRTLQRSSREISFENDTNIIIKVIVTVLLFLCDAGSRCRYFLRIKKKDCWWYGYLKTMQKTTQKKRSVYGLIVLFISLLPPPSLSLFLINAITFVHNRHC